MRSGQVSGGTSAAVSGPYRSPEWQDGQRLVMEARRLQAEWLSQQAGRLGRVVRGWLEPLVRGERRRADLRALLALDDHVLTDIGLRRDDLSAVLSGVLPWEQVVRARKERLLEPTANVLRLPQPDRAPAVTSEISRAA